MKSFVNENYFYFEKNGQKFGYETYFLNEGNGGEYQGILMSINTFLQLAKNVLSEKEIIEAIEADSAAHLETDINLKNTTFDSYEEFYCYAKITDLKEIENILDTWEPYIEKNSNIAIEHRKMEEYLQNYKLGIVPTFSKSQPKMPFLVSKGNTQTKKHASEGYVYLISAHNGFYKIGKSINVSSRFKAFETIMPVELIHSFHSKDYSKAEKTLHNKYAEVRRMGEWFELNEDQIKEICSIKDDEI